MKRNRSEEKLFLPKIYENSLKFLAFVLNFTAHPSVSFYFGKVYLERNSMRIKTLREKSLLRLKNFHRNHFRKLNLTISGGINFRKQPHCQSSAVHFLSLFLFVSSLRRDIRNHFMPLIIKRFPYFPPYLCASCSRHAWMVTFLFSLWLSH